MPAMIIDGVSLQIALFNYQLELLELAELCKTVICCRVTPLQKALTLRLVKHNRKRICLGIGDGANDVSMIRAANVGVGIMGKEGSQAARSADYAIQRFKHLKPLLTIHGRYSFIRLSLLIQYAFYKNITFILPQLWWSFFMAFSGQSLYDDWTLTFYNLIFTSLPPLFMGTFEKDVSEKVILKYPQLYASLKTNRIFSIGTALEWFGNGILHSLILYFGIHFIFKYGVDYNNGEVDGLWSFSQMMVSATVTTTLLKAGIETKILDWINTLFHLGKFNCVLSLAYNK